MKSIPPKQKAIINGETLEYVIAGSGNPAIVLINGSGGPIEGWHKVLEPLATLSMVFAYDRPGVGGSSKPLTPQTGDVMVDSLRALLCHAKVAPPYILVGHSLGGLIVNLYARLYPTEISGIVLLDATPPEDISVMAKHETIVQRLLKRVIDIVFGKNEFAETRHVSRTVELINQAAAFPSVPLIVVTGGKPAMSWATAPAARNARAQHQRQLAALSPTGKQVIAKQSGHFPQFSEPDVVVEAVREVMAVMARE